MRNPLALLVASTALSAALGVPAWTASRGPADAGAPNLSTPAAAGPDSLPLMLASDDDDDDDFDRRASRDDDDDDDDDSDDDDCDDDDDDGCGSGTRAPAPAGAVAPPANGLFGTGAPPQVTVN